MPRPKGSKNVAKGKRPHDDDFDENPTERKSSRRSASTPSTAESPKKAAKISPKKQSNDSKELLEDYFEDEMEGIQQFLNETSEKSPNHQVPISPTFYEQLFCTKVFRAAFLSLQFELAISYQKEICAKTACKMLVKLPTG